MFKMASIQHTKSECQQVAIRQLENDLIDVLEHEIDVVLTKAWSVNIVGEQVRNLAQASHLSCRIKAQKFVTVVRARVKTDHNTFELLLRILKSSPSLGHLADRLNEKLCPEHRLADSELNVAKSLQSGYQTSSKVNNGDSKYQTRTPPRQKKKRRSIGDRNPVSGGPHEVPKLETARDLYTDEESGFLDESSEAVNAEPLLCNDSEKTDGDEVCAKDTNHGSNIFFDASVEAESDYKPFSTDVEVKPQSSPSNGLSTSQTAPSIVGQEIRHNAATQQVVTGSGVQPTAEGWAAKASFFISQGATKEVNMANEIEQLKKRIAFLEDIVDAKEEENQKVEQMEEHIHEQEAELKDPTSLIFFIF